MANSYDLGKLQKKYWQLRFLMSQRKIGLGVYIISYISFKQLNEITSFLFLLER